MAKTTTAVATKEAPGALVIPDFMKEHAGLGTEAIGAGSVEVPRIKLIQKISPELDTYNDLKAGDFFHSILEESLGTELRVCPIYVDERYILWRPQEDAGGGILARADDGIHWSPANAEFAVKLKGGTEVTWRTAKTVAQSGLANWGSSNPGDSNSPPAATKMFNIVVTFPDKPDLPPAVITLQRSSVGVGKKLMGKLKITRAPSFGLIFKVTGVSDTNKAGQSFLNYSFISDGTVTVEGFYRSNFEYYKMFKEQGVQIRDMEALQDDDRLSDTPDNSDKPKF